MTRILNLRKYLLESGLVEDSDYLQKYLDLIYLNLTTKPVKAITQAHHVIPVCYYKQCSAKKPMTRSRGFYDRLAADDPNNFLVNLKYSDHLLAHCYLALCAKPNWFKFANANMITVASKYTSLEDFAKLENLVEYQEAYTLSCELKQGKTLSIEHKAKIAAAHRKENISAEYSKKLSEAGRRRTCTAESKSKISQSLKSNKNFQAKVRARNKQTPPAKGLIWITNGEHTTRIKPSLLSEYTALGYWAGKTKTIQIHKGYQEIVINSRDWPLYEAQGWKKYWNLSKADRAKYTTNLKKETDLNVK